MNKTSVRILPHWLRALHWRIVKGYSCCDYVGANYWIAKKIAPILRQMADDPDLASFDPGHKSVKDWQKTLDKIAGGFEAFMIYDDEFDAKKMKVLWRKYQRGMKLFAKYFPSLWI